jgi:hypothetical protein
MTTIITDLGEAILRLQHAFRRHGIEPAVIELSSWEDGQVLQAALLRDRDSSTYDRPSVGLDSKGNAVNQVEIAGTIVRWPALQKALPGGGFDIV